MKLIFMIIFVVLKQTFQHNLDWPNIFINYRKPFYRVFDSINTLCNLSAIDQNVEIKIDITHSIEYWMPKAKLNGKKLRFKSNTCSISNSKTIQTMNQLKMIHQATLLVPIDETKRYKGTANNIGALTLYPHKIVKGIFNIDGFLGINQQDLSSQLTILKIISIIVTMLLKKIYWKSTIFIFLLSLANAETTTIGDLIIFKGHYQNVNVGKGIALASDGGYYTTGWDCDGIELKSTYKLRVYKFNSFLDLTETKESNQYNYIHGYALTEISPGVCFLGGHYETKMYRTTIDFSGGFSKFTEIDGDTFFVVKVLSNGHRVVMCAYEKGKTRKFLYGDDNSNIRYINYVNGNIFDIAAMADNNFYGIIGYPHNYNKDFTKYQIDVYPKCKLLKFDEEMALLSLSYEEPYDGYCNSLNRFLNGNQIGRAHV